MINNETYENIGVKLQELSDFENNRLLLLSSLFTRKTDDLKRTKLSELNEYLYSQLSFYNRNEKKYEKELESIKNRYSNMISDIIAEYNGFFISLLNENSFAKVNQKIAIANLVSSQGSLDKAKEESNTFLQEKAKRKIFATAQKKLNYDLVIDETYIKLEECMDECLDSINSIFTIANNKLVEEKGGFFAKIVKFFSKKIGGDKNFKKYVLDDLNSSLKRKQKETTEKCSEIKIDVLTFVSQINIVRKDLNIAFNQALNQA